MRSSVVMNKIHETDVFAIRTVGVWYAECTCEAMTVDVCGTQSVFMILISIQNLILKL